MTQDTSTRIRLLAAIATLAAMINGGGCAGISFFPSQPAIRTADRVIDEIIHAPAPPALPTEPVKP